MSEAFPVASMGHCAARRPDGSLLKEAWAGVKTMQYYLEHVRLPALQLVFWGSQGG